jgi:hypothetical protein
VLTAAVYDTLPLPLPVAPAVTVNHGASLVAVHAHPAVVVTVIGEPAPPVAASVALVGAIEYAQDVGAAWLTVKVRSAIVRSPLRAAPVLAAAV